MIWRFSAGDENFNSIKQEFLADSYVTHGKIRILKFEANKFTQWNTFIIILFNILLVLFFFLSFGGQGVVGSPLTLPPGVTVLVLIYFR